MTSRHDSTRIAALDELGRRLQAATERPRSRRLPARRWTALTLGVIALASTPAIASVSGIFDDAERVEDTLPHVGAAVDRDDPTATGLALNRLGYRVHWVLITDNPDGNPPTLSRHVSAPPAKTKILAVLNERGGNDVTPGMRDLLIEISPAGSAILTTHP